MAIVLFVFEKNVHKNIFKIVIKKIILNSTIFMNFNNLE